MRKHHSRAQTGRSGCHRGRTRPEALPAALHRRTPLQAGAARLVTSDGRAGPSARSLAWPRVSQRGKRRQGMDAWPAEIPSACWLVASRIASSNYHQIRIGFCCIRIGPHLPPLSCCRSPLLLSEVTSGLLLMMMVTRMTIEEGRQDGLLTAHLAVILGSTGVSPLIKSGAPTPDPTSTGSGDPGGGPRAPSQPPARHAYSKPGVGKPGQKVWWCSSFCVLAGTSRHEDLIILGPALAHWLKKQS